VSSLPLRSISIADYRRLEGHRVVPLDAPVVLLYGPNGTGKTSILSALELALTGEVRSMRRHDPRYTAHLPFHGQDFATLRATVSDALSLAETQEPMTVGGSRITGAPALQVEAARFYAERCYLDQVSLGQLLELYQYREGKEESALARFVNELLGLEQLDALWTGLSDATDLRRLKKLSEPLADAESEAQKADDDLLKASAELKATQDEMARVRARLVEFLHTFHIGGSQVDEQQVVVQAAEVLRAADSATGPSRATYLVRSLTSLGGRVEGLSNRRSVKRLDDARAALLKATERYDAWRHQHAEKIAAWRHDAAEQQIEVATDASAAADALAAELRRISHALAEQAEVTKTRRHLESQIANTRTSLSQIDDRLASARERAGSLVEGLSLLRVHTDSNVCPVCDRDFSEVSSIHLTMHVGRKLDELTSEGERLRQLREQRINISRDLQVLEQQLARLEGIAWSEAQRAAFDVRRTSLNKLEERLQALQPAISVGVDLESEVAGAAARLEQAQDLAEEATTVASELGNIASAFGVALADRTQSLQETWRTLTNVAEQALAREELARQAHSSAQGNLHELQQLERREDELKTALSQAAERKLAWTDRVREARRRQSVARAVQDASSAARTEIIQRVFTDSLNRVWRDVFTRLAPREPFVPAFGIPSAGKAGLTLQLETVHGSGVPGGPPQMMLSAGNLNTAALSLFIALHLAVAPLVPCLVFDDPVQSMDEVHVAQFAALIRVLSKHHNRQVIIAVHDRELFEYLRLELSPAYAGDELLTIELGERSGEDDGGVTRLAWSPDAAIAM
jgi:exonuclease SbcC